MDYLKLGFSKLKLQQIDVYQECIEKKSGGLCLNLGSGKTLISLVVGLELSKDKPIIVVCSKTLLSSWQTEIIKFFGPDFPFILYHSNNKAIDINNFTLNKDTKVILTTPDVLAKFYKQNNIHNKFITQVTNGFGENYTYYNKANKPFITTGNWLYTNTFGTLIVDEAQNYTNVSTIKCRAIASLHCKTRWVTSGTLFDEPKIERILGYYLIINHPTFPRDLPSVKNLVNSDKFKGTKETLVLRKENKNFIKPKINEFVISNNLTVDEEKVYMSMKKILALFNEKVIQLKLQGQNDEANKFASYLLAIIVYLRQCIVCPLLPISNIVLDISDYKNKSDLSKSLFNEIKKCDLDAYFSNPDSIYSSRIKKVIEVVNNRQSENIVIFTCFRTCLDTINYFLPKDRNVFCITSKDTLQQRNKIIEDFKKPTTNEKGNIFLLTYQLGAEGLNLQTANTVLLVDFFWNNGKTQQAIGRVYRQNQMAKEVNIYYFTSNTAMEKVIFEKQNQKLIVLEELHNGQIKSKIDKIKTSEIIKIITSEENNKLIKRIK